jgi:hypothetical protein
LVQNIDKKLLLEVTKSLLYINFIHRKYIFLGDTNDFFTFYLRRKLFIGEKLIFTKKKSVAWPSVICQKLLFGHYKLNSRDFSLSNKQYFDAPRCLLLFQQGPRIAYWDRYKMTIFCCCCFANKSKPTTWKKSKQKHWFVSNLYGFCCPQEVFLFTFWKNMFLSNFSKFLKYWNSRKNLTGKI